MLHPYWAMMLGKGWSRRTALHGRSRTFSAAKRNRSSGLRTNTNGRTRSAPADLFICGHTHCAEVYPLSEGGAVAFLGEWIDNPLYGVLGPGGFELKGYPDRAVIGKSGTTRQ